jgi:hypothetical protein
VAAKRRGNRDYFVCPQCGADVPADAAACPECGADADTGWSEDGDTWGADIPTGYGKDEDFDYDEFVEQEFPQEANPPIGRVVKKWAWRILVAIVCLALLLYLLFW